MRAQIRLTVGFQPNHEGNFPYTFQISLVGLFGVIASTIPVDPLRLLQINGSSILFGAAREMIANFTCRGPFRSVLLPSFSFMPENANKPEPEPNSETATDSQVREEQIAPLKKAPTCD